MKDSKQTPASSAPSSEGSTKWKIPVIVIGSILGVIVLGVSIFLAVYFLTPPPECGIASIDDEDTFGWIVHIFEGSFLYCVGSLLSDQWVVTSKNCYSNMVNLHDVIVVRGREEILIKEYVVPVHPETETESNLVLMRLAQPFEVPTNGTGTVCLPYTTDSFAGRSAIGAVVMAEISYRNLQAYSFTILESCKSDLIDDDVDFCVSPYGREKYEIREGVPMMVKEENRYVLVGVQSGGLYTERVYANVPLFSYAIWDIVAG